MGDGNQIAIFLLRCKACKNGLLGIGEDTTGTLVKKCKRCGKWNFWMLPFPNGVSSLERFNAPMEIAERKSHRPSAP